jgi:hypothetical protein
MKVGKLAARWAVLKADMKVANSVYWKVVYLADQKAQKMVALRAD